MKPNIITTIYISKSLKLSKVLVFKDVLQKQLKQELVNGFLHLELQLLLQPELQLLHLWQLFQLLLQHI